MIVYKGTAKALRKNALVADDRLVMLGDGSAMLFRGDTLVQSDVRYKKADSHVEPSGEQLPEELKASKRELDHVSDHGIALPVKLRLDTTL